MKKLLYLIFSIIFIFLISGCGGTEYSPKQIGNYGETYRSSNRDIDGSNSVINVSNIETTENLAIVDIGAPTAEQIAWAYKNFLYFDLKDEKGNTVKIDGITLEEPKSEDVEVRFTLKCNELKKCKYIEIGPYKMANGDKLIFKLD